MKITMVCAGFPPSVAGNAYYAYHLSKRLAERGHEVTVFVWGSYQKTFQENIDNVVVVRVRFLPLYPFHLQFNALFLQKELKSIISNQDILHLHNANIPFISFNIPTVVTVHGTMQGHVNNRQIMDMESLVVNLFSKMYVSIDKKLIESSDEVISVSEACSDELKRYYNINKSKVIYNGVDTNFFKPDDTKANIHEPYVLYAGRLSPEKGLFDLIDSIKIVSKTCPDIKLIIIGKGPMERTLRNKVRALELSENIKFLGSLNHDDLLDYYQSASIYVLPSYFEGLATTLLEALACGVPIITTNIPANSEAVIDSINGFLVPPKKPKILAESILALLSDTKLRKKMGNNSRKRAMNYFDWDIISKKIEDTYYAMLNLSK